MRNGAAILEQFRLDLQAAVGDDCILGDPEAMAANSRCAAGKVSHRPFLVVQPRTVEHIRETVQLCIQHGVALVPQGGNTGLAGGAVPASDGREVVLSLSRLDQILEFDARTGVLTVEAGCVLNRIDAFLAPYGFFFPLRLASRDKCQIGGNLATNAGGGAVLRYGMARQSVLGLEVVLADGEVWSDLRPLSKNNAGYDLKNLFIGSEGTLGIITKAVLQCQRLPSAVATAVLWLPSLGRLTDIAARLRHLLGCRLSALELYPQEAARLVGAAEPGLTPAFADRPGWSLLIEVSGADDAAALQGRLEQVLAALCDGNGAIDAVVAQSRSRAQQFWAVREGIFAAQQRAFHVAKHDISVPVADLGAFIIEAGGMVAAIAPSVQAMPFGHIGDGNIHFNLLFDKARPEAELAALRETLAGALYRLAGHYGGSISAEHGIGQLEVGALYASQERVALRLQERVKQALDPYNLFNPGKMLRLPSVTAAG